MIQDSIREFLISKIEKGETISPFLFLGNPLALVNEEVQNLAFSLAKKFSVDKNYIFIVPNSEESIKIEEIRDFITPSFSKSSFAFQIFIIENISRLTISSANILLKFLEEPGKGNIIFLTSASESGILDTILSRVKLQTLQKDFFDVREETSFVMMIEKYIQHSDTTLVRFMYNQELTDDIVEHFLKALISYIAKTQRFSELLSSIEEDITVFKRNNLNAKSIVDKYILQISGHKSK